MAPPKVLGLASEVQGLNSRQWRGNRTLKIAMLSVHSCPLGKLGEENTGGMSVYLRELAREIGRRGHVVDIYTRTHESFHDPIVTLGENARLIHLRAGHEGENDKLALYSHLTDFALHAETFRKRNGLEYDLIHSHYWLSGWVGKWLQRLWRVPHLIMFHTLGAVKNAIGIGEEEPGLRIQTEQELVKSCHCIIGSTQKEKEYLIHYYGASPERIRIVPCGVNLDLFRPIDKGLARSHLGLNGGGIILFVGRVIPLKGIDRLLRAMTYLEGKEGLKLIVIGGDEHRRAELERLKSLSRSLLISNSVDFLGVVEHEKLPLFYNAADLCVVPSYYESFGLVVLESLACGTPVVATKVGGVESVIHQGETGYVVTDNAPHCLADKIALLLSASKTDSEMANSTRASVTRFGWSNIAETIVGEYRAVLRDRSTSSRTTNCSCST